MTVFIVLIVAAALGLAFVAYKHPAAYRVIFIFALPIAEALAGPHAVTAVEASGWPTGAVPASVCADDAGPSASASRRYEVTLRPLLPGEQP